MPRLFVAIDLPERIRDDLSSLYCAIPGARWMEDDQIHLTLRFIGEVEPAIENKIISALGTISIPPFTINLKNVGVFPPRKEPRVLWIGIQENNTLLRLQNQIERSLVNIHLEPDTRKFHAHITIARLNNAHKDRLAEFISTNNLFCTEPFEVSEYILYRSYLGKDRSHYVKEATFRLH